MQIDPSFIPKICNFLKKRVLDFEQSTEQQFLGLCLIKEIIETPMINDDSVNKKKKTKKFQNTVQEIKKSVHYNKAKDTLQDLKLQAKRKLSVQSDKNKQGNLKSPSKTTKSSKKELQLTSFNLQEIQSQQYIFCI